MKLRFLSLCLLIPATLGAACTSPVKPAGSVTITAASPVSPANGAQIANAAQPVTLTVTNALVTDASASVTYTFEVSTDSGFVTKVATKDVPQTPGQTAVKLDTLAPAKDYYWHVRATSGDTVGTFAPALKFTIGPAVVIQAPAPLLPANGSTLQVLRPIFTVSNAVRSGPVTTLSYRFEISTASNFSTILLSGTVPEGSNGQTSFTPSSDLSATGTYFWRASATDAANGVTSSFSAPQSVTLATPTRQSLLAAQQGLTLWSGVQPPGTNGKAKLGSNWEIQTAVAGPGGPLTGTVFTSPRLELLQIFDLLDRGFDMQPAIDWMHANGYATTAVAAPAIGVIGFSFEYIALINGAWDLVIRVGG